MGSWASGRAARALRAAGPAGHAKQGHTMNRANDAITVHLNAARSGMGKLLALLRTIAEKSRIRCSRWPSGWLIHRASSRCVDGPWRLISGRTVGLTAVFFARARTAHLSTR